MPNLVETAVSAPARSTVEVGTQRYTYVLAIELLTAVQAIDLNPGLRLSQATQSVVDRFRADIPFLAADRLQSDDIELATKHLRAHRAGWAAELR